MTWLPGEVVTFHDHPFGRHPWAAHSAWGGRQVLQVHRADDRYSVWKFFDGGQLLYWYINFEAPIVRDRTGFDTDDHGLDLLDADDRWWAGFDDWTPG